MISADFTSVLLNMTLALFLIRLLQVYVGGTTLGSALGFIYH